MLPKAIASCKAHLSGRGETSGGRQLERMHKSPWIPGLSEAFCFVFSMCLRKTVTNKMTEGKDIKDINVD